MITLICLPVAVALATRSASVAGWPVHRRRSWPLHLWVGDLRGHRDGEVQTLHNAMGQPQMGPPVAGCHLQKIPRGIPGDGAAGPNPEKAHGSLVEGHLWALGRPCGL